MTTTIGENVRHRATCCSFCNKSLDVSNAVNAGDAEPVEGDATLCYYCGHIMIFNEDLSLRDPNESELQECSQDPNILEVQALLKEYKRRTLS